MKKTKKYVILFLMLVILILSGCNLTNSASFDKFTVKGSKVEMKNGRYEITSNLDSIRAYINVNDEVGGYKVTQVELSKDGYVGETTTYECYPPTGNNPYEDLKEISANKQYQLTYEFYKTNDCSNYSGEEDLGEFTVSFYTYTESLSNEQYISVENIESKLGNWSYSNKNGSTKVSCASYGIEDKEENIPLCVALARVGASASDCAGFLKDVYQKATGERPPSIYGRGSEIEPSYTSSTAQIPSGLKDGDLITLYNNGNWAHIGMVFYWDAKGAWYAINGGMSGKVKLYTIQETLDNSNTWTKYVYRSQ